MKRELPNEQEDDEEEEEDCTMRESKKVLEVASTKLTARSNFDHKGVHKS